MSYPIPEFDARFGAYRACLETRARRRVGREEAEDLVGRCYLEARKSLTSYRPERDLLAWLTGILDNQMTAHLRRRSVQREDLCADTVLLADGPDVETAQRAQEEMHHEAQRRRLYALICAADLTDRQRECLLRTLSGETQQQIADSLRITQRMASYHLQAAHQRLADVHKTSEKDDAKKEEESDFKDSFDCFWRCAHQNIYRKPHSFDNQSTSEERERKRYACLQEG